LPERRQRLTECGEVRPCADDERPERNEETGCPSCRGERQRPQRGDCAEIDTIRPCADDERPERNEETGCPSCLPERGNGAIAECAVIAACADDETPERDVETGCPSCLRILRKFRRRSGDSNPNGCALVDATECRLQQRACANGERPTVTTDACCASCRRQRPQCAGNDDNDDDDDNDDADIPEAVPLLPLPTLRRMLQISAGTNDVGVGGGILQNRGCGGGRVCLADNDDDDAATVAGAGDNATAPAVPPQCVIAQQVRFELQAASAAASELIAIGGCDAVTVVVHEIVYRFCEQSDNSDRCTAMQMDRRIAAIEARCDANVDGAADAALPITLSVPDAAAGVGVSGFGRRLLSTDSAAQLVSDAIADAGATQGFNTFAANAGKTAPESGAAQATTSAAVTLAAALTLLAVLC
jgi:hypothetical protein